MIGQNKQDPSIPPNRCWLVGLLLVPTAHNTSSSTPAARPYRHTTPAARHAPGSPDTPLSKPVQVRPPKWARQVQGAHARDQVSLD